MYFFYLLLFSVLLLIAYAINYVYVFYLKLKHYPTGPIPLPILGNSLMLIGHLKRHNIYFFKNLAEKYGDIYTFWLLTTPVVIISGIELAKEVFNKDEFSNRFIPYHELAIISLVNPNSKKLNGVKSFTDEYKSLRKSSVEVLRKFLSTNKLCEITHKIVDETVQLIFKNESEKPFVPNKYIDNIIMRTIIGVSFGKILNYENIKVHELQEWLENVQRYCIQAIGLEYMPILKLIINYKKLVNSEKNIDIMTKMYKKLDKTNLSLETTTNSLSELYMLSAINSTENKEKAQYLTDDNIIGSLLSLFFGGSETSQNSIRWMILFMACYPEMQKRLREEVRLIIGNRTPEISDKTNCDYIMAFICETLRFRIVLPYGVPHTTTCDINIANTSIPKGTLIFMNLFSILNDSKHWDKPEIFNPNRFLDSEQHFNAQKCKSFIPFGIGKRMCVGDKFAINDLFLILSRFLQNTDGYHILLANKNKIDIEPDLSDVYGLIPKTYKIMLDSDDFIDTKL